MKSPFEHFKKKTCFSAKFSIILTGGSLFADFFFLFPPDPEHTSTSSFDLVFLLGQMATYLGRFATITFDSDEQILCRRVERGVVSRQTGLFCRNGAVVSRNLSSNAYFNMFFPCLFAALLRFRLLLCLVPPTHHRPPLRFCINLTKFD